MHNLVEPDEWEIALGPGGALEALTEARDQGLVRFIGVTGHGTRVAEMHARLAIRPREGAQLMLGFVGRRLVGLDYALGAPPPNASINGAYGLVGPGSGTAEPYVKGVLRSVGRVSDVIVRGAGGTLHDTATGALRGNSSDAVRGVGAAASDGLGSAGKQIGEFFGRGAEE